MALGRQLRVEQVRTLAFGGISGTYATVGSPSTRSNGIIQFQNLTDTTLMFSFDGLIDHFPLPTSGYAVLDLTTNKPTADGLYLSVGTQFYVKTVSTAATSGSVYITMYYGND